MPTIDETIQFFYGDHARPDSKLPKKAIGIYGADRYHWTHGHKPKGFGGWGFELYGSCIGADGVEFWHTGTFGEAKAFAVEVARTLGYYAVAILT